LETGGGKAELPTLTNFVRKCALVARLSVYNVNANTGDVLDIMVLDLMEYYFDYFHLNDELQQFYFHCK